MHKQPLKPVGAVRPPYVTPTPLEQVEAQIKRLRAERDALEDFLRRLAREGGSIVATKELSAGEIAAARAEGRLVVLPDGTGYAYLPEEKVAE
jgi:hypothetical protein